MFLRKCMLCCVHVHLHALLRAAACPRGPVCSRSQMAVWMAEARGRGPGHATWMMDAWIMEQRPRAEGEAEHGTIHYGVGWLQIPSTNRNIEKPIYTGFGLIYPHHAIPREGTPRTRGRTGHRPPPSASRYHSTLFIPTPRLATGLMLI